MRMIQLLLWQRLFEIRYMLVLDLVTWIQDDGGLTHFGVSQIIFAASYVPTYAKPKLQRYILHSLHP